MRDMMVMSAFTSRQSMTSLRRALYNANKAISSTCVEHSLGASSKLRNAGSVGTTKHLNLPLSATAAHRASTAEQRSKVTIALATMNVPLAEPVSIVRFDFKLQVATN